MRRERYVLLLFLTLFVAFVNVLELLSVPALRGKDYGKSKMSYPDYTETESGLQYKVNYYWNLQKFSLLVFIEFQALRSLL